MNTLKKIRQRRNEMFPDRCKLKFGTEFVNTENIVCTFVKYADGVNKFDCSKAWCYEYNKQQFIEKILGQPVTIVDVLRMLNSISPEKYNEYDYIGMTIGGTIYFAKNYDPGQEEVIVELDLSKGDYLRDQSPEVIEKLGELLLND